MPELTNAAYLALMAEGTDLGNTGIGGSLSTDGPYASTNTTDNNATFDPFKNTSTLANPDAAQEFRIPTETEYAARCNRPSTCYSACQEADRINREKCDNLRKRVACALKDRWVSFYC